MQQFHGTTILSVRRQTPEGWQVAIGGDGQVTLGNIVIKSLRQDIGLAANSRWTVDFGFL